MTPKRGVNNTVLLEKNKPIFNKNIKLF